MNVWYRTHSHIEYLMRSVGGIHTTVPGLRIVGSLSLSCERLFHYGEQGGKFLHLARPTHSERRFWPKCLEGRSACTVFKFRAFFGIDTNHLPNLGMNARKRPAKPRTRSRTVNVCGLSVRSTAPPAATAAATAAALSPSLCCLGSSRPSPSTAQ
jgi:hypothetical protein